MSYQKVYTATKTEAKRGLEYGYQKASRVNIVTLIKVIAVILITVVAFVFGKGLITKIKGWFGLGETGGTGGGLLDGLTGGGSPAPPVAGTNHHTVNPSNPNSMHYTTGNLVDSIYQKLDGYNPLNMYPTEVNKLANLSLTQLKHACHYWGDKYKPVTGKNFYQFIYSEIGSTTYYAPALAALKKTGYYG